MAQANFDVGDQVIVLDGSKIRDYSGGWVVPDMQEFVGQTRTVINVCQDSPTMFSYNLEGCHGFYFDERGLVNAEAFKEEELKSSPYMNDIFEMFNTLNGGDT